MSAFNTISLICKKRRVSFIYALNWLVLILDTSSKLILKIVINGYSVSRNFLRAIVLYPISTLDYCPNFQYLIQTCRALM